MAVTFAIEAHATRAINLRHRLHRIPELGFQEVETAKTLRAELDELGIPHVDGVADAPTATIAVIGDVARPCIALRADIDALPILEQTGLPYASIHRGRMHACGHDGHSAALMGAAAALQGMASQLPVCVKLIWQPAEEEGGGAERLVRAGVLDGRIGPRVQAIFGLHGWPGLPLGVVATRAGALLANTDTFKITFTGRGCHGAYPHLGADPIVAACEAVNSLQRIVSREIDPTEPAVVTVGMFHAGTATNIVPSEAVIEGTFRTLTDSVRARVRQLIARRCESIAHAGGCTAHVALRQGYPATINTPEMADYVASTARELFGPQQFLPVAHPSMGGEDFAYYLQKVPGCFVFVGVEPHGSANFPALHTDRYDYSDSALSISIALLVGLARNFAVG